MIFRTLVLVCIVSHGCCQDDQSSTGETSSQDTTSSSSEESTTHIKIDISTDKILTEPDEDTKTVDNATSTDDFNLTTIYVNGDEEANSTATLEPEVNQSPCYSNPCKNGGTCIQNSTMPNLFTCECIDGFVGIRCGTEDRCEKDEDGVLCGSGTCKNSEDDLFRTCHCFFHQHWDSIQKKCREADLPCFPNPCMNGGECTPEGDTFHCECKSSFESTNCSVRNKCGDCARGKCLLDEHDATKYCLCDEGLYWNVKRQTCEELTSPCLLEPCQNNGTCSPVNDVDFNCSCAVGYSGERCEVVDKCTEDEHCGGHGKCTLSEDESERRCQCDKGYFLIEHSNTCEEITSCKPNPCLHDGICTIGPGNAFDCTCAEGYTGPTCNIRNMCEKDGGKDFCAGGECRNVYELDIYVCNCEDKQYFDYLQRKCSDVDLCPLMTCGASERCVGEKCECLENFHNSTGVCTPNFCMSNPCTSADMVCEEGSGENDYKCSCKPGYAFNGTHCNVAFCVFPSLSKCSQLCELTDDGYRCECTEGFHLEEDNKTCSFEGNTTCSNKTCDGGFCYEKDGDEICVCPNGYVEKDGKCIDICSAGHFPSGICPSDNCEPLHGAGFKCKCEEKYALSDDKATCRMKNVCHPGELGERTCTERKATCYSDWIEKDGFKCVCENSMIETSEGNCHDVCSVENNQRNCSMKGADCEVDTNGKMFCKCPPYFQKSSKSGVCNKPADVSYIVSLPLDRSTYSMKTSKERSMDNAIQRRKIARDITLAARGMFFGFTEATLLTCSLKPKHILCNFELQFSKVEVVNLRRLKSDRLCLTGGGNSQGACILPPSLVLMKGRIDKDVEIEPTDPCWEIISRDLCGSETRCTSSPSSKNFNCSCKPGFEARKRTYPFASTKSYIDLCRDVDECSGEAPCPPNSNCQNTIGSYRCSCKPGYRSVQDPKGEKCLEICRPNPCTHGECSPRGNHDFDCTCEAGYRGTFCNLEDKNFKGARINTVIVGVVLGGVLLLTIVLFVACVSRLKKKRYLEDPSHMLYNSAEMVERKGIGGGAINNAYQRE